MCPWAGGRTNTTWSFRTPENDSALNRKDVPALGRQGRTSETPCRVQRPVPRGRAPRDSALTTSSASASAAGAEAQRRPPGTQGLEGAAGLTAALSGGHGGVLEAWGVTAARQCEHAQCAERNLKMLRTVTFVTHILS